jgi:hypothetical protein
LHAIDNEELKEVKKFVAMIAFLSFNEIVFIAKTSDKDDFIKGLYDDVSRWYFSNNDQ